MRALDGADQILAALGQAAQGLQGQRAGDFAALVAAHAVGHRPQVQRRATQQGILVVLAHPADSRQRRVFRSWIGKRHGHAREAISMGT
ncbi:hypothetical protein D3C78_1359660 [compost metagenome]